MRKLWASLYPRLRDRVAGVEKHYLLGLIDPQPGQRILDLGCGWGGMLNRIAEVTGDPSSLQGWTLSQQQQAHIQAQAPLTVEIRDFVSAPMAAGSWDTIFSIGSLEHVPRAHLQPLAKKLAASVVNVETGPK